MGIRKILVHDIRMQKNPQTKEDTYLDTWNYVGPKSNLHSRMENSSVALLIAELSICCYFFKYFVLTLYLLWLSYRKKTTTLNENSLNI